MIFTVVSIASIYGIDISEELEKKYVNRDTKRDFGKVGRTLSWEKAG